MELSYRVRFATDQELSKAPFDRVNAALAAAVFFISLIVYYLTVAPTMSFWDCGEFIACSSILGIAHPPGFPLYLILGRVFSVLPLAADISMRINLFSVISAAVAALFGYLVIVRIIRHWFHTPHNGHNRLVAYMGGFTGALFAAFSSTNWANSVEAEVYAATMAMMLMVYWLALKYFDNRENISSSRIMLLAMYIGVLGIGVHLTIFAVIPIVGLYFVLKKEATGREWAYIGLFFLTELLLIFELSSREGEVPYYIPAVIFFIIFVFHMALKARLPRTIAITGGLYLLTLYPFYFTALDMLLKNISGAGLSAAVMGLADIPLGWVGVIGLTAWGLYSFSEYIRGRKKADDNSDAAISSLYCLIPAALILLMAIPGLGGYHTFLVLTGVTLVLMALALYRYVNWVMLAAIGGVSLVVLGFWQFVWGLVLGSAAILILGFIRRDGNWKTALMIILVAIAGYSIHTYIPVRSAQNPSIDENNPSSSFASLVGYLERKQYGTQSMVERMFVRRAEWGNQFGDYQRMGFWRFFKEQYGFHGPRFFIVLILGLFGVWETIRRRPDIGLPFLITILVCTVGLVLYMNFADGTRFNQLINQDYIEVRNRDYFFTPGFLFFGLAIGLGIAGFMDLIKDVFEKRGPAVKRAARGVSYLLVLLPLVPLKANYFINDRSNNYMAYDYAYNILQACDDDAILITNGDNDTFPVWCIQEVYGYRTDVRVVNLALSNIGWYIKQLKNYHNVPLRWSDEQIDQLRPYRVKDGSVFRLQDQVVDEIITANRWQHPIHMTVTTPEDNRRYRGKSIDDHLALEGMLFTLTPEEQGRNVGLNYEKSRRLYEQDHKYRGTADSAVYKDEATRRLINNYSQGFIWLADSMRAAGESEKAFGHIKRGLEFLPESFDLYAFGAQVLAELKRVDTMETYIQRAGTGRKAELYMQWGISAGRAGNDAHAQLAFERVYERYPEFVDGFHALASLYYRTRQFDVLKKIVFSWVARHPEDLETRQLLYELERRERSGDTLFGKGSD